MNRLTTLIALLALGLWAAPAGAQTWTASAATTRHDVVNEHTFDYDFTDGTASDGVDVRQCSESLTAALDGSTGDTSDDSRVRLYSCPAEQDGSAPDSADGFQDCTPALSGVRGEFSARPVSSAHPFLRVQVITPPSGGDTSRLTITCGAPNYRWNGSTWVGDGLEGSGGLAAADVTYAGGTGLSAAEVESAVDELADEKANTADLADSLRADVGSVPDVPDPTTGAGVPCDQTDGDCFFTGNDGSRWSYVGPADTDWARLDAAPGVERILPAALYREVSSDNAWLLQCSGFANGDLAQTSAIGAAAVWGDKVFTDSNSDTVSIPVRQFWHCQQQGSPTSPACTTNNPSTMLPQLFVYSGAVAADAGIVAEANVGPMSLLTFGADGGLTTTNADMFFAARVRSGIDGSGNPFAAAGGTINVGIGNAGTSDFDGTDDRYEPVDGLFFELLASATGWDFHAYTNQTAGAGTPAKSATATMSYTYGDWVTLAFRAHWSATPAEQTIDVYYDGVLVEQITHTSAMFNSGDPTNPVVGSYNQATLGMGVEVDAFCRGVYQP